MFFFRTHQPIGSLQARAPRRRQAGQAAPPATRQCLLRSAAKPGDPELLRCSRQGSAGQDVHGHWVSRYVRLSHPCGVTYVSH